MDREQNSSFDPNENQANETEKTAKAQGKKASRRNKWNFFKTKRKKKGHGKLSPDSVVHQILPIVLTALAAFFGVCVYTRIEMGVFGNLIHNLCFGIFGGAAYIIPVLLLLSAILWKSDAQHGALIKTHVFNLFFIFVVSVLCYTFGMPNESREAFGSFYALGKAGIGGGFLGGVVGYFFNLTVSKVGTTIFMLALCLILFVIAYGGRTKKLVARFHRYLVKKSQEAAEKRRLADEARQEAMARQSEQKMQTETSFYEGSLVPVTETNTADPTEARDPSSTSHYPQRREDGERAVIRRFFDPELEEENNTAHPADFDRKTVIHSQRDGASSAENADAPDGKKPSILSDKKEQRFSFSDDETLDIHVVSNRPIPENPQAPFSTSSDSAGEKDDIAVKGSADETTVSGDTSSVKAEDENASPIKPQEEKGKDGLIIKKPHVVEHIGAETLVTEDDSNKHAGDTFFYSFPPLSLLHEDDSVNKEDSDQEIADKAQRLENTLKSYGVDADIEHIWPGPRLTRYELVPKPGVRISKIENLVDEITMNLEALSVRIEAPIPGRAAIGVEVPNINTKTVRLRGLLDTATFRDAPGKTTVCLGVDVVGVPVFADLDKMPHLLVAGATGMGKSVCINAMLVSLLYKARPDEVKLILIDPKKVEFQSYANIPHLLVPVVTEPQKAAGALAWAVNEMERRYDLIETACVRNIVSYNKTVADHPGREKMPQIVIVIDELHDLMLQAREAVEDSIARIAAKARAAGILLIIGTQRPSVNVITGVIKANIPSRIAFHVASQVDSRTILDVVGAEKLLNNGDMLFLSPGMKMMKPKRVQGAFLDDDEVNRVTDYLRKNSSAVQYDEAIMVDIERESEKCSKDKKQQNEYGAEGLPEGASDDDIFYSAVEVALESGKISTSLLQRRLSLGYGKAARLIDRMCDMGLVSPPNGQKPRDVLVTYEEYQAMRLRNDQ